MIKTHIAPYTINDDAPMENEIATAVRKLANGKAHGHSGIRAEHLEALLQHAKRKDATDEDRTGWEQVCHTIQQIFKQETSPKK
jgi:hypothetical protein